MTLPYVATDLPAGQERQHRTLIANTVNDLVRVRPPNDTTEAEVTAGILIVDHGFDPYDFRRYGAVADGTTDNTTLILAVFTAFSSASVMFYACQDMKYDFNQVVAAIPPRCVLKDESMINAWNTGGFRQKATGFYEGADDTAINDFQHIISSGHNAALMLDNRGTAASGSGTVRVAMIMWCSGRFTKQPAENGIRGLARHEFSKIPGQDKWWWLIRRMVPWAAANYELWYTGKTYAAGSTVINGSIVYRTAAGGVAGASAPVHGSGTVSDGGIDWTVLLDNIDSGIFIINENGEIAMHTAPVAGVVAYLKADPDGPAGGVANVWVEASNVSQNAALRLIPTNAGGGLVDTPYLIAADTVGLRGVNSAATQAGFAFTDARMFELAQNGLAEIVAADGDTTPSVAGAGRLILRNTGATSITVLDDGKATARVQLFFENSNTTLVHDGSTFLLKGGVNVNPAVFNVIWMEKYSGSAAWFETGRNF
jgi:hypothetical protein